MFNWLKRIWNRKKIKNQKWAKDAIAKSFKFNSKVTVSKDFIDSYNLYTYLANTYDISFACFGDIILYERK